MKHVILALFICLAIPFSPVFAAENVEKQAIILPVLGINVDDARPLRPLSHGVFERSIDHIRIQRENGDIIELSGIEIPLSSQSSNTSASADDTQLAAKEMIDSLFSGQVRRDITLYQTPKADTGRQNRMGHALAHVVRKDGSVWVQGALVANGLAYARPTPSNPELARELYALESSAIQNGLGIWAADGPHAMVPASDSITPLDRFAVVEGTVQKVSTVNNVTYLNFGNDWRKDFTIGIPSAVRQALARQNIDVFSLQGQKLRVRGWIRSYNGPYIELEHPVLLQQVDHEQANATNQ